MITRNRTSHTKGFTIVELAVVIMILGILAGLVGVSWNGWQKRSAESEVKSDLAMAASAMESTKNFSNGYPSTLPTSIKSSENVSLQRVWGDSTKYCIQATNLNRTSVVFYIRNNQSGTAQSGSCPAPELPPSTPSPSAIVVSSTSVQVSWPNVSGATSYAVRYGTGSPTTLASCTSSPCTIGSLATGTTYNISVVASNSYGSSTAGTTTVTTSTPAIPAPSAAGVTYTTSRVKIGADYYQRYVVTASGGTCSVGSTEWKIGVTGGATPNWSGETWQSSNTRTVDVPENGIYSSVDVTIYVKPRCVSGGNSTEGNPAYAYNGSGGGAGGAI